MILCENYHLQAKEMSKPIDGLANAEIAVMRAFAKGLEPPPAPDYNDWAVKNVVFGNDSEFSGSYDPDLFPFYKEILECLQPDHPAREVIFKKSAQIGGTVVAQVFVGAGLDLEPGPFAYIHPSLDNGKRWVRTKWAPFVKQCLPLRSAFQSDSSRETANSIFYKERRDGRGWLMISGANSASSLSMFSVPKQVQDDLSKWEDNEAGDSQSQADSRSNAFLYAKIFKLSTPMIKGTCKIDRKYEASDQREWEVPCPHCDHEQPLTWENFKKSICPEMDPAEAHFTCDSCGSAIEHHFKRQIVGKGKWVARNPSSDTPGFYLWSAYSPLTNWAAIAKKYLEAMGDPAAEHNFYNDWLGLAYEQKGEAPPWEQIRDRANSDDGYDRGLIPPNGIIITCGIDCQGDRVEWHAKAFGPNLQRFTIDYGVIEGHISEETTRKALDILIKKKFKNSFGRAIGFDMVAVDANYSTEDVLDWVKKHPENKVIAVRGQKGEHTPPLIPVKYERKKGLKIKRNQKRFFNVGTSPLKASLFKHLEKETSDLRGYCGYPRGLDDDFFQQLCSERRVLITNKRTHYAVLEWQKLPNVRNEVLDTEIYAEAGARRLGWTEINQERWDRLRAEREVPPSEMQMDMLDPSFAAHHQETESTIEPVDISEDDDGGEDNKTTPERGVKIKTEPRGKSRIKKIPN